MNRAFPSMAASGEQGMDLRDWLAGQAMLGVMSSDKLLSEAYDSANHKDGNTEAAIAHMARRQADAMIRELERE